MKKVTLGLNGRIVIPKSIRKEMSIDEGSPLIITFEDGAMVVRADQSACRYCGLTVESQRTMQLCDKCIRDVLENYNL